jgi:hypothetical protein
MNCHEPEITKGVYKLLVPSFSHIVYNEIYRHGQSLYLGGGLNKEHGTIVYIRCIVSTQDFLQPGIYHWYRTYSYLELAGLRTMLGFVLNVMLTWVDVDEDEARSRCWQMIWVLEYWICDACWGYCLEEGGCL